jgi:hypothetical protein
VSPACIVNKPSVPVWLDLSFLSHYNDAVSQSFGLPCGNIAFGFGSGLCPFCIANTAGMCCKRSFFLSWESLTSKLKCMINSIEASICELGDTKCTCTNAALQAEVEKCVLPSCTVSEAMSMSGSQCIIRLLTSSRYQERHLNSMQRACSKPQKPIRFLECRNGDLFRHLCAPTIPNEALH